MSLALKKYENKDMFRNMFNRIPSNQSQEARLKELKNINANPNLTSEQKSQLILTIREKYK